MFRAWSSSSLQRGALLVFLLAVMAFRIAHMRTEAVHNDERHYTVDGMWSKVTLTARERLDFLWNHAHPHPFLDPRTGEIGYHGQIAHGFPDGRGDLGPHPRAGHPCLYMGILGLLYLPAPREWLLEGDHYVHFGRNLNIVADAIGLLLLFDILRRIASKGIAAVLIVALALWPYTMICGSQAYLDPLARSSACWRPGTIS